MQKSCSRCNFFASRAAKPACRPAIFTGRPDRLLFYYFISIWVQAGVFCISGRKTSAGPFTIYLFTISFLFGSRQEVFASRAAAKPACRPAIFTGRPDRLLFYYFISIGFQAGGFCISGRKTCMLARHFHRSAGPFTVLIFHFHWGPGRRT